MSNFPASLDSFGDPQPRQRMDRAPKHAALHKAINDAMEAVQAAIGVTGSTDTASADYRLRTQEYHDSNGILTGAAETMSREAILGFIALASGSARFRYFTADKSMTVSNITVVVGTTAGATPTLVRLGLYSVAGDNSVTLIGSTPNDTTLFNSSGVVTKALSSPVAITRGSRYAFAPLVVSGASMPTLAGQSVDSGLYALAPRMAAFIGSQTDLPASVAIGSLGNTGTGYYARLT